jgi:type IV pilus assembly protein PilE
MAVITHMMREYTNMQRHKGFTLMELMITMAIVAIIAAVAYPSYLKSAMKGRRADAKAAINAASQSMERCYATYGLYNSGNCAEVAALTAGVTSPQGYYKLTFATPATDITGTYFEVTATAVSTGPQANDTGCTVMALDSVGKQTSAGATTDTGGCW